MPNTSCEEMFKKPVLSKVEDQIILQIQSGTETSSETIEPLDSKKIKKQSAVNVPLPYTEPEWSGIPPPNFSFEIIKNGTSVSNRDIKVSCLVFGRLDVCDVIFEHPSVSRYHAVIQYCKGDDSHPKGFYLYDLGSTHGTFLNKEKVSANVYYKLKVGYVIKFGGSSRLHIFQGPEEEEVVDPKKEEKDQVHDESCNWGMGEDAIEEDCMSENPFALSTPNEELYLDDPKKTLRGWFEREGYELEYNVEESGFRTFKCIIQLPVDTPTGEYLPVEASVSGKKKEAVVACALEACRTLDSMGLLRQSHQESKQQKRKKWEENDYYDSDEDTFFDRTGEIEKRREMRKRLSEKKPQAETFQSLEIKLKVLFNEMEEIKNKLSLCSEKCVQHIEDAENDSLESYMTSLTQASGVSADKFEKRKLKLRLIEAEKEKSHLEKLLNIARPAQMPALKTQTGIVGKKPKSRLNFQAFKAEQTVAAKSADCSELVKDQNSMEEKERDTEKNKSDLPLKPSDKSTPEEPLEIAIKETASKFGLIIPVKSISKNIFEKVAETDCTSTKEGIPLELRTDNLTTDNELNTSKNTHNVSKSIKESKNHTKKQKKETADIYKTGNSDYSTWVPPLNQSGDGMTHLNAKYGY